MTPLTSDNERRGRGGSFVSRGIGHNPTFRCWGCGQGKSTAGARALGPLKLKHCAACVAAKEAR